MGPVAGMVSEVILTAGRTLDGSFVNSAARDSTRDSTSTSDITRDSDSTRELEIIERFFIPIVS